MSSTPCLATITFEGLMVFHPYQGCYEVGILIGVPDHQASICVNGCPNGVGLISQVDIDGFVQASSPRWFLEVRDAKTKVPRRAISPQEKGHSDRDDDRPGVRRDFSWIMDFEGAEFYNSSIIRVSGML